MHGSSFGLKVFGCNTTIDELRTIWRLADEARFDHVWVYDHLTAVASENRDDWVYEGWTLLAAMATLTRHVRFGALVSPMTYRHPGIVAKAAVTVDHLSGGRLEFGIGAGWEQVEHESYGIEGLDHRVGRFDEGLRVIRSLWTQDRTTFDGRYYQLRDAIASPKPIQRPHPPIWIGAGGDRMLRLVARHADVWMANNLAQRRGSTTILEQLDEECRQIGRDPASLRRGITWAWDGQSTAELLDRADALKGDGFSEQIVKLPPRSAVDATSKLADALGDLRALASKHVPG
jgi:probable F420-dependent oxidoreductase